jgi:hypothetical protein
MNERIKECWLKAAREDSSDKWDTQEEFIERFAKLIVNECCQMMLDMETKYPANLTVREIKKHFGV